MNVEAAQTVLLTLAVILIIGIMILLIAHGGRTESHNTAKPATSQPRQRPWEDHSNSLLPAEYQWTTDEVLRCYPALANWLRQFPRGLDRQNAYDTLCSAVTTTLGLFAPDDAWIATFVAEHPAPDYKMGVRDALRHFPDLQDWLTMWGGPEGKVNVNDYAIAISRLAAALAQLENNPNNRWILTFIAANPPPTRNPTAQQPSAQPALPPPPPALPSAPPVTPPVAPPADMSFVRWPNMPATPAEGGPPPFERRPQDIL